MASQQDTGFLMTIAKGPRALVLKFQGYRIPDKSDADMNRLAG